MAEPTADLLQMQQDAIRRVHMMQKKAQQAHASAEPAPHSEKAAPAPKPQRARLQVRKKPPQAAEAPFWEKLFGEEREQVLLLVLLLVLLDEQRDMSLIFALLYLIL